MNALSALGVAYAQWGQTERAYALCSELESNIQTNRSPRQRIETQQKLAFALAWSGQWEYARSIIRTFEEKSHRAPALYKLGEILIRAHLLEQAEAVLLEADDLVHSLLDSERQKPRPQGERAPRPQGERASRLRLGPVGSTIPIRRWQVKLLREIQATHDPVQQRELSDLMWTELETLIYNIVQDLDKSGYRDVILQELTTVLIQVQWWERARMIAHVIHNDQMKFQALSQLGQALVQAEFWEQADSVWAEIMGLIDSADSSSWRFSSEKTEALAELANALARMQQWNKADSVIAKIRIRAERAKALRKLVTALVMAQHLDRAETILKEMEVMAHTARQRESKTQILCELGIALTKVQRWQQAETVILTIDKSDERIKALREMAVELSRAGEDERLLRIVQNEWLQVTREEYAVKLLTVAAQFIKIRPEIGIAFYEAFNWVDTFFKA